MTMNTLIMIILVLFLGAVIGVFLILNNKINNLLKYYSTNLDISNKESNNIEYVTRILDKLLDRFNKRILVDNEHFEILNSSINDKYKDLSSDNDYVRERLNTIDSDTQNLIIAEHRCTRNEIKKKAKISSKIKSNSKTNKSINHKQKCE